MRQTLVYNYSLSLTDEERIKLDVLARELRESKNSVIRIALKELYENKEKEKATQPEVPANEGVEAL